MNKEVVGIQNHTYCVAMMNGVIDYQIYRNKYIKERGIL
jgi:hypothetical protein